MLAKKYDVVVTNPPYMGGSNMSGSLSEFVRTHYPNGKSDLCAAFIEVCLDLCCEHGLAGMMTSYTWMFLSSYQELRKGILTDKDIVTLVQPEYHSFFDEAYVPICTFVLANKRRNQKGVYFRLADFYGAEMQNIKLLEALQDETCYYRHSVDCRAFLNINGFPLAYWVSENFIAGFNEKLLPDFAEVKKGLSTGDINRFTRFWHEVYHCNIGFGFSSTQSAKNSDMMWFPYCKGGNFRRWYGNHEYIVNWRNDGYDVKNFVDDKGKQRSRPQNVRFYFQKAITYSAVTVYKFSTRFMQDSVFGGGGDAIVPLSKDKYEYLLAFLNSCVAEKYLQVISPTINYEVGHILSVPIKDAQSCYEQISEITNSNVNLSRTDWDSFETSWDFKHHPLIPTHKERSKHND